MSEVGNCHNRCPVRPALAFLVAEVGSGHEPESEEAAKIAALIARGGLQMFRANTCSQNALPDDEWEPTEQCVAEARSALAGKTVSDLMGALGPEHSDKIVLLAPYLSDQTNGNPAGTA